VFEPTASSSITNIGDTEREYRYNDLNLVLGQQIRLLVVQPGEPSEPVVCDIIHVNLKNRPEYEAVSYTWAAQDGNTRQSQNIRVLDGSTIKVTDNCEAALRQVRKPRLKRWLWIDSVCIHQSHVKERNHQVGLMGQIYSQATKVLICIHDPSYSYSDLFHWLKKGDVQMTELRQRLVDQTYELITSRYFRRVWVVQEVALAREAVLHVNTESLLLSGIAILKLGSLCERYNLQVPGILRRIPGVYQQYDLLGWLGETIMCESTDPKDKVYAITSLLDPDTRSLIPINYSSSLQQIYANVLVTVIRDRRDLGILSYVRTVGMEASQTAEEAWLGQFHDYVLKTKWLEEVPVGTQPATLSGAVCEGPWRSTIRIQGTHQPHENLVSANNLAMPSASVQAIDRSIATKAPGILPRIRVRAHYIDQITSGWPSTDDVEHLGFLRLSDSSILQYFCRTATAHMLRPEGTLNIHTSVLGDFQSASEYNFEDLLDFFDQLNHFEDEDHKLGRSWQSYPENFHKERGFKTTYSLGFAFQEVDTRDEVWAVDGVRHALVLRKTGQLKYQIVGRCYLWAALQLDCWNPGSKKGLWGTGVERPQQEQTHMIDIH
jgi:hypothetical protein